MRSTVAEAWEMQCPQCGKDDCIEIEVTSWARLTPDGTDFADAMGCGHEHQWTPESSACCTACDHCARVQDFHIDARPE